MSVNKVLSDGSTQLLAGATLWADMPIGTVIGSFSESAPAGFLYCDDTAYSASSYPELWAILPSTVKNTTNNTFTIDLRESTLKGVGLTSKSNNHYDSDGVALGEFVEDRIQSHTHGTKAYMSQIDGAYNEQAFRAGTIAGSMAYLNMSSGEPSGRSGATTEVKSTGVRWYIKAKQVALPADLESAVEDAVEEMCTDTVTSGSTAPITSGGVYNRIYPYEVAMDLGSDILSQIKASADNVQNYNSFTGSTQAGIECCWFGFKKVSTYWHCTAWAGNGYVIHVVYNNGTYTQRAIIN